MLNTKEQVFRKGTLIPNRFSCTQTQTTGERVFSEFPAEKQSFPINRVHVFAVHLNTSRVDARCRSFRCGVQDEFYGCAWIPRQSNFQYRRRKSECDFLHFARRIKSELFIESAASSFSANDHDGIEPNKWANRLKHSQLMKCVVHGERSRRHWPRKKQLTAHWNGLKRTAKFHSWKNVKYKETKKIQFEIIIFATLRASIAHTIPNCIS